MAKYKNLLFPTFIIIFLFGVVQIASAVEVASGPCAGSTDISSCVVNYFKWGVGISGVIALVSFAIGAVGYIISGGSAEVASSSKDRMRGAIFGLVLLGASYIILNTINPAFVGPVIAPVANSTPPVAPIIPGVYLYTDTGCQNLSYSTTVSLGNIGPSIKGIQIIDDTTNNINYGVILHQVSGLKNGGPCGQPIKTATPCQPTGDNTGAIDVFLMNQNPSSSGTGATFYSKPYGMDKGAQAGFDSVQVTDPTGTSETPDSLCFDYTNVDVPDSYKYKCSGGSSCGGGGGGGGAGDCSDTACETFKDCPGSIDLQGDYLLAIYSSGSSGSYCQTFTDSVVNLNAEPIVASGTAGISNIIIFPTGNGSTTP